MLYWKKGSTINKIEGDKKRLKELMKLKIFILERPNKNHVLL